MPDAKAAVEPFLGHELQRSTPAGRRQLMDMSVKEAAEILANTKVLRSAGVIKTAGPYPGMTNVGVQQYAPIGKRREFSEDEQKDVAAGESNWLPALFPNYGTPASDLLASPGKQSLLAGLAAGGLGAGLGGLTGTEPSAGKALLAGSVLGIPAALMAYAYRKQENENLKELMRRLPHGATQRDLLSDPVYQRDRELDAQARRDAALMAMARSHKYGSVKQADGGGLGGLLHAASGSLNSIPKGLMGGANAVAGLGVGAPTYLAGRTFGMPQVEAFGKSMFEGGRAGAQDLLSTPGGIVRATDFGNQPGAVQTLSRERAREMMDTANRLPAGPERFKLQQAAKDTLAWPIYAEHGVSLGLGVPGATAANTVKTLGRVAGPVARMVETLAEKGPTFARTISAANKVMRGGSGLGRAALSRSGLGHNAAHAAHRGGELFEVGEKALQTAGGMGQGVARPQLTRPTAQQALQPAQGQNGNQAIPVPIPARSPGLPSNNMLANSPLNRSPSAMPLVSAGPRQLSLPPQPAPGTLAKAGSYKQALSPTMQAALIGAGIGGLGTGLTSYISDDPEKPRRDRLSRAIHNAVYGSAAGGLVGGGLGFAGYSPLGGSDTVGSKPSDVTASGKPKSNQEKLHDVLRQFGEVFGSGNLDPNTDARIIAAKRNVGMSDLSTDPSGWVTQNIYDPIKHKLLDWPVALKADLSRKGTNNPLAAAGGILGGAAGFHLPEIVRTIGQAGKKMVPEVNRNMLMDFVDDLYASSSKDAPEVAKRLGIPENMLPQFKANAVWLKNKIMGFDKAVAAGSTTAANAQERLLNFARQTKPIKPIGWLGRLLGKTNPDPSTLVNRSFGELSDSQLNRMRVDKPPKKGTPVDPGLIAHRQMVENSMTPEVLSKTIRGKNAPGKSFRDASKRWEAKSGPRKFLGRLGGTMAGFGLSYPLFRNFLVPEGDPSGFDLIQQQRQQNIQDVKMPETIQYLQSAIDKMTGVTRP